MTSTTSPSASASSPFIGPAPYCAESMCPATTAEPAASPGTAPAAYQPSTVGRSGSCSAPEASTPTGTSGAGPAAPGSEIAVGAGAPAGPASGDGTGVLGGATAGCGDADVVAA